jgi:signal transduction histidine kinase
MLKNIFENASRYTKEDKKQIDITVLQAEDAIQIIIRDYGPGLEIKDLDKVFEPFFRAEESRSRSSGGYGLGLYLTKQIADAHGGRISIQNHESGGAEVSLSLPKKQS